MARAALVEIHALSIAARDPRTPWLARAVAAAVAAYALSPIDLIPDVIPVLGYLDDLILLPLGVFVARKLIPEEVLIDARVRAAAQGTPPVSRLGALLIFGTWLLLVAAAISVVYYLR